MENRNIAILIFEGVQIIDYSGPYEAFGQAGFAGRNAFDVFTVAETTQTITTAMGMSVNPKYAFDDCPPIHVLVVPGGSVTQHLDNARMIDWIRAQADQAEMVLSVCNGAFYLAKAGLLDGLEATTTALLIDNLQTAAPNTHVVSDRRFVDNGKIITAAGLSSGIDGALHVIGKLLGRAWAQQTALNMEYDWRPTSNYTRAMLADMHLPEGLYHHILQTGEPLNIEGDTDYWEETWRIQPDISVAELKQDLHSRLTTEEQWVRLNGSPDDTYSEWNFSDGQGRAWRATINIAQQDDAIHIGMRIDRTTA